MVGSYLPWSALILNIEEHSNNYNYVYVSLLHEDSLDELHGEGGLAHAAAAEHHDLVLTHARLLVPGLKMAHKL